MVVQEGVQGSEAQRTVAAQDGPGGAAEAPTGDRPRIGLDRRKRGLADGRRPPTLLSGDHGPQLVARSVGQIQGGEATAGELEDLRLDGVDLVQRLVALDLEGQPAGAGEAGQAAVRAEPLAGHRRVSSMDARLAGVDRGEGLRDAASASHRWWWLRFRFRFAEVVGRRRRGVVGVWVSVVHGCSSRGEEGLRRMPAVS
ncbi:MAG: hypothetical protein KF703_15470 [Actinobacteria bacterium]|nr:hypothetical protein [Actinomycetota bacterium]